MAKTPHRKLLRNPQSQWEASLDQPAEDERAQAGEIEPGDEIGGGGDKGIDAETGDGRFARDAVLAGPARAPDKPGSPLDPQDTRGPRTHDCQNSADTTKRTR